MKKIYLVRHAKSSWDDESLSDFDRPLNERGKSDAAKMGARLQKQLVLPQLMLTSGAKRARSTCKRIARELGYSESNIAVDDKLYHASEEMILEVIRKLPEKYSSVMIFGHNPGFTDFVNELNEGDPVTGNIPTCGVAAFEVNVKTWKEVNFQLGNLLFYDYPKNVRS